MISVNTHEAKSRLSELLATIEKEDEVVVICRAGKPVAELRRVSVSRSSRLAEPHPLYGAIQIKGDLVAPLDEADLPEDLKSWNPGDVA